MQAEPLFEFSMEFLVRQRDHPLGVAIAFGPHDRDAISGQRQNRKRSGGQEMLLGAAIMFAFMRDGRDDGRLIVIPAMRDDASLFADFRTRAVGADQQACLERLAIGAGHNDRMWRDFEAVDRGRPQVDAEFLRLRHQCINQVPVFDHVCERLTRFDLTAKCQESRPHRVVEL